MAQMKLVAPLSSGQRLQSGANAAFRVAGANHRVGQRVVPRRPHGQRRGSAVCSHSSRKVHDNRELRQVDIGNSKFSAGEREPINPEPPKQRKGVLQVHSLPQRIPTRSRVVQKEKPSRNDSLRPGTLYVETEETNHRRRTNPSTSRSYECLNLKRATARLRQP